MKISRVARRRVTDAARTHRYSAWRTAGVALGTGVLVPRGSELGPGVSIGDHTVINGPAVIRGGGKVSIGARCAIAYGLLITSSNHSTDHPSMMMKMHWRHGFEDIDVPDDVSVGAGSWLADRVTVLAGARLGPGTVVAAGAVVTRGVYPPFAILAGVPAKVVRLRAPADVIDALLEIAWWEWDEGRIARNREFFNLSISEVSATEMRRSVKS